MGEFGANKAGVSVRPSDLAPDDADLRATDLLLRTVNERDLLSEIELSLRGVGDALNLDQRGVGVVVPLAPLVGDVAGLDVESVVIGGHFG